MVQLKALNVSLVATANRNQTGRNYTLNDFDMKPDMDRWTSELRGHIPGCLSKGTQSAWLSQKTVQIT